MVEDVVLQKLDLLRSKSENLSIKCECSSLNKRVCRDLCIINPRVMFQIYERDVYKFGFRLFFAITN